MNLIDVRQVVTQILGFLLMLWILRKLRVGAGARHARGAPGEDRRRVRGGRSPSRRRPTALQGHATSRSCAASRPQARASRSRTAVAEGQRVAGEIHAQAQTEAAQRLERAEDEIEREREKAKELLKEQIIPLSMRTAEKILRQKLDDPAQRKLVGEFIDEVGALR